MMTVCSVAVFGELLEFGVGGKGEQRQLCLDAEVVLERIFWEMRELEGPAHDVALVADLVHVNQRPVVHRVWQLRVEDHV